MAEIELITDDAGYYRVQARLRSAMNTPMGTVEEEEELRLLAKEISRYSRERFPSLYGEIDGPSEIACLLDSDFATLEDLLQIFGGMERFIDYMTRKVNIDGETIDAIAVACDTERERLDKPFSKPEGWQDIDIEPNPPPCDDPKCCDPDEPRDWREVLLEHMPAADRELAGIAD